LAIFQTSWQKIGDFLESHYDYFCINRRIFREKNAQIFFAKIVFKIVTETPGRSHSLERVSE
jgi:hypothetical protein